ncbi:hypothetical protein D3C87_1771600 [compost metagenome]
MKKNIFARIFDSFAKSFLDITFIGIVNFESEVIFALRVFKLDEVTTFWCFVVAFTNFVANRGFT